MKKPRRYISDFTANYESLNLWNIKVIFEDRKLIKEYKLRFDNIAQIIETMDKSPYQIRKPELRTGYCLPDKEGIALLYTALEYDDKIGYYFYIKRH